MSKNENNDAFMRDIVWAVDGKRKCHCAWPQHFIRIQGCIIFKYSKGRKKGEKGGKGRKREKREEMSLNVGMSGNENILEPRGLRP